ncbi:MYZAP protein, partial [Amia calva]|nr:MYZAP protein [Amia calva]
MIKYGSGSTVTTSETQDPASDRRVRRLRLTLHSNDVHLDEMGAPDSAVKTSRRRRNGYTHQETPTVGELPILHLSSISNRGKGATPKNAKIYGVVHRPTSGSREEVVACEWSLNQLQDEMKYIREVRDSLEKVRERMYGEFGGMKRSIQKLSREMHVANSQQQTIQAELKVKTEALESFDQMNSSLMSATIDLQKTVLENCLERTERREEVKSLRSSYERALESMQEKERQLAAALAENENLRLKIESSQEANSEVLKEMTQRMYKEYEERLQEEQRKHREEIEAFQARIDDYVKQIEETNEKVKIMEAKIIERDERLIELERLIGCMEQEKSHFTQKLKECEMRMRRLRQCDHVDAAVLKRSRQLEEEASSLKERIKHLNDMVFCQQRKVKDMIEEVNMLKSKLMRKDMYIAELLDRISIVECENNELQDKLNFFLPHQNGTWASVETLDGGLSSDLPLSPKLQPQGEVHYNPFLANPEENSSVPTNLVQPNPFLDTVEENTPLPTSPRPTSPVQPNPFLDSAVETSPDPTSPVSSSPTPTSSAPTSPVPTSPVQSSPARGHQSRIYTPYMQLMEISARLPVEEFNPSFK